MPINKKLTYRPDIDGLRALAILLVLAFHYYPHWIEGSKFLQGGFIGVDIFFVISGFLITRIICNDIDQNKFSLKSFYSRRIRRIFPSLLLMLAVVLIFGWYVLLPDEYTMLSKYALTGILFSSNFLSSSEIGYFDDSADVKPLLHLWSLGIEEQFYIFWPIFLIIFFLRKKILYVALIFIFSFSLNIYYSNVEIISTFYNPITRAWELIMGGVVAIISRNPKSIILNNIYFKNILAFSGLFLIFFSVLFINGKVLYPYYYALLPTLGSSFLILAGSDSLINKNILSNQFLVYIGLISFPLYLWHWPLLVLFKISLDLDSVSLTSRLALLILSFILASLSFHYIELPIRKLGMRCVRILLICSIILASIALLSTQGYISPRLNGEQFNKILSSKTDWVFPGNQFSSEYKDGLRYYHASKGIQKTLFIGDSNLEQYSSRINFLYKNNSSGLNSSIIVGNQRNCSTLEFILRNSLVNKNCLSAYQKIVNISKDDSVKNVVIAAQWNNYRDLLSDFTLSAQSINNLFKNKNVYLILTMPTGPELDPNSMFSGSRFSSLKLDSIQEFNFASFYNSTKFSHEMIFKIAKIVNAEVIDPIKFLCVNDQCPVINSNGTPLYKDSKHMTSSYARDNAIFIDHTLIFNK